MKTLPEEYHQEPSLALEAEKDGLAIVMEIIQGAKQRLNEGGVLIVEVGNSQLALEAAYPDAPFTWLEFYRVGYGVFLLSLDHLQQYF